MGDGGTFIGKSCGPRTDFHPQCSLARTRFAPCRFPEIEGTRSYHSSVSSSFRTERNLLRGAARHNDASLRHPPPHATGTSHSEPVDTVHARKLSCARPQRKQRRPQQLPWRSRNQFLRDRSKRPSNSAVECAPVSCAAVRKDALAAACPMEPPIGPLPAACVVVTQPPSGWSL
jgi:hypothetical protein